MSSSALLLSSESLAAAYGEPVLGRLRSRAGRLSIIAPAETWRQHAGALREVEVIFSGWGVPRMDGEFLRHVPNLRAVFYAGGSVRHFVTEEFWRRGIRLVTAQAINAIPVAEYATSALQLGLKRFWHFSRVTRESRNFPVERPMPGVFGSTVGLVSYGIIGRQVRQKLQSLDLEILVHDPFLSEAEAQRDNLRKVGLDELFAAADAVSLHTPLLPETVRLIKGRHFELMKPGAFFLNTARGGIVDEAAMIAVLQRRPDLQVVLDVTAPEPPPPDSLLYTLPNVVLTPHIAGSMNRECLRMGQAMVDEFERYLAGRLLQGEITAERAALIA
jgi:phosphoglycerate dehydrogenase-like enzyme